MAELNDDAQVLGGQIKDFLRDQRTAHADKQPLPRLAILDDPKANPVKRMEAEQAYGEALLRRKTSTA